MKPTDIFNAIENIPDKYIDAAKPSSVKQYGESRSVVKKSVRDAEAVSRKTNSLSDARQTHSRKDSIRMSTKQPVLQRIATAFAAVAACAVFAGGGLFIVHHARQNQQDSDYNSVATAQISETEPAHSDAEPAHSDEGNMLGGWGQLHPVDWDVRGSVALLRDDVNYYFFNSDGKWYSCPLTGGEKTQLPARIAGAQAPQDPFFSDGERVYTKDMIVVSEGTAVNSFDTAAIRAYLNELNDDETDNGYYYSCDNIWHIRNRYFLHIIGEKPESNDISIELWADDSGKIISHEKAQAGTSRYFCNGHRTEMCEIRDGFLDIIDCPGDEPDDKPDSLAYGKILDLYYDMNGSYFQTENRSLYTFDSYGQKACITDVPFDDPLLMTAPDGRFFYVNMERLNFSLREWNENGTDEEIYAPENSRSQELWICGYEQTGNNSYNIVLKHTYNQSETGFVFVDPTTGQIVKEIK